MKLEVNHSYKLVIEINRRVLTFRARIIEEDEDSITFIDVNNAKLCYKKSTILSAEELEGGNQ